MLIFIPLLPIALLPAENEKNLAMIITSQKMSQNSFTGVYIWV
jgi:hypothetical protein